MTTQKRVAAGKTTGGQFDVDPRAEAEVSLGAPRRQRPDSHGGYRFTRVKSFGGHETEAFSAVLTRGGVPVATVSNDGNGGCSRVEWKGARYDSEQARALESTVAELFPDQAFEPEEKLFDRLLTVAEMNRKRSLATSVAFVGDGGPDFWETGEFSVMPLANASQREAALRMMDSDPRWSAINVRVWDKDAGDFITPAQALAKS